jgi:hypothetical protein
MTVLASWLVIGLIVFCLALFAVFITAVIAFIDAQDASL